MPRRVRSALARRLAESDKRAARLHAAACQHPADPPPAADCQHPDAAAVRCSSRRIRIRDDRGAPSQSRETDQELLA